jgi:hypothetical protein
MESVGKPPPPPHHLYENKVEMMKKSGIMRV